jgi:PAS domain S-box-containing protein
MITLRTTNLGRGLCLGGAALGAIGLIGWLTGAQALVAIVPGQPAMMPNTALALLLLGMAGASLHDKQLPRATRLLSLSVGLMVLAIGLGTLAEYALDIPFSIDQLLIPSEAGPYPGRPSPPTALALACLAAAVLLLDLHPTRRTRGSEWLILCAGLIAFTALLGQAFGAGALYELIRKPIIGVAVHTALGLLMISVGLLLERPDMGVMRMVTSSGPGGMLVRRLAPIAVLVPVLFGITAAWLVDVPGVEDISLIFAALIVISSLVSLLLLAITAQRLDRAHDALEHSNALTRDLFQLASDGIFIADLEGRYVDVNDAGCRMLGYSREEILGKTILDFIPPEDEGRLWSDREKFLHGGMDVSEWRLRTKSGTYLPVEVSAKIHPDGRWQGIVRDISERKRAEEQLRQAQERLELALKGADLATWDWNIKTGEVIFNPRWPEMRGFRPEEVSPSADSWSSGIHPDDQAAVQSVLNDCFGGVRSDFEFEYRVAKKSGEWIWILDRGKVFARDAQGHPTRMVGTELDITARRHAEERIRQAQERVELALKGADLGSWDWNVATGELIVNPRFAEMRGFRPGEIAPRVDAWFAGVHPDDLPGVRMALNEHFEKVLPEYEREFRMSTKKGDWIWVLSRGRVFSRDELGRPTRIVGTVLETTTRKRAEDEVRLSEAKFSGIVSISADAIISIDENQRITLFNKGAEKIFGWSSAEVIGGPLDILIPERFRAIHARHVDTFAAAAGAARRMGARDSVIFGVRKNGEEFPADAAISGIVVGGRRILTVALRDITELKEAEAAAKRASRARDDILGIVAHDLRNPLAAIVSLAHVLRAKGPEAEVGNEIAVAANRMNRLIGDLLDVTRMEAGHLSLKRERLPAAEIITDALEGQTALASSASLELRLETAPELPDISADRDRLLQVFENLIGNAIKFTKPGGRITLGATARAGEVLFSVSDTGRGIASTHLPHVFDRFWQVPGTERRGIGFGLAIVKGIVEAHGGRVWVQSSPGEGSTFFFTIPTAAAQTIASHAAQ